MTTTLDQAIGDLREAVELDRGLNLDRDAALAIYSLIDSALAAEHLHGQVLRDGAAALDSALAERDAARAEARDLGRRVDMLIAERAALRAQLWDALGMPLVSFPEQWNDPKSRADEGRALRAILTRHLREDETR